MEYLLLFFGSTQVIFEQQNNIKNDEAHMHQQVHEQDQLDDEDDVICKRNHWASWTRWTRPTSSLMEWTS